MEYVKDLENIETVSSCSAFKVWGFHLIIFVLALYSPLDQRQPSYHPT